MILHYIPQSLMLENKIIIYRELGQDFLLGPKVKPWVRGIAFRSFLSYLFAIGRRIGEKMTFLASSKLIPNFYHKFLPNSTLIHVLGLSNSVISTLESQYDFALA